MDSTSATSTVPSGAAGGYPLQHGSAAINAAAAPASLLEPARTPAGATNRPIADRSLTNSLRAAQLEEHREDQAVAHLEGQAADQEDQAVAHRKDRAAAHLEDRAVEGTARRSST